MAALYRLVLFNGISQLKTPRSLGRVVSVGFNALHPQRETPGGPSLAGPPTAASLSTMADKADKVSASCSRRLSSTASTPDGAKARVKRVSIEGNIGEISSVSNSYNQN